MTDDNMSAAPAKPLAIRARLTRLYGDYRRTDQPPPAPDYGAPTSEPRAGP